MLQLVDGYIAGVLCATAAALVYALWNIYLQRGLIAGASNAGALYIAGLSRIVGLLPLLAVAIVQGTAPPLRWQSILLAVVAGLLTGTLGQLFTAVATRLIGAATSLSLRLLDPVFALIIGFAMLGDTIGGWAVGGIGFVIAALAVLQQGGGRKHAAGQAPPPRGIAAAVAASVSFTAGNAVRKAALALMPSPVVLSVVEGPVTLASAITGLLRERRAHAEPGALRRTLRSLLGNRDLWISGLASTAGSLLMNIALQHIPLSIAMALRNLSPWFALVLVPLLVRDGRRPGGRLWVSTALLTAGMLMILFG